MRWRIINETRFHRFDEPWLGGRQRFRQTRRLLGYFISAVAAFYLFFFKRSFDARLQYRSFARIFFFAIGFPFRIALFRDLFHRPAGLDRLVLSFLRGRLGASAGLQDQPLIFFPVTAADA